MSIYANVCGGYAIPGPEGPPGPGVPAEGAMMSLSTPLLNIPAATMTPIPLLVLDYFFGTVVPNATGITVTVPGIYRVEAGVSWNPDLTEASVSDRRLFCTAGSETVDTNVASADTWNTTTAFSRSFYVAAGERIGDMGVAHTNPLNPLTVSAAWLNAFLVVSQDDLPGS